ncbi:MAG: MBL fold metallo-hydrolase [Acidobacteriota bacterium]|nr:MBL fold metallo-hydrolase [Acidobacteriota bacterium]
MDVEFWGVRGTSPVCGRDQVRHGGGTACASLTPASNHLLVIDAGTGIRGLGGHLVRTGAGGPLDLALFLTHFHLDHIIGFPFFAPVYSPEATITIYAAAEPEETEKHLGGLMAGRNFPLELSETPSRKTYRQIGEEGLVVGGVKISICPLRHPQGCVAYKFEERGRSVIFATDTEHPEEGTDEVLVSFCRNASHLVYDAMYTVEEYAAGRKGWGHSTWQAGTRVARAAGVQNLVLSHFNPDHSDGKVDEIVSLARRVFPRTVAAHPGMKIR